MTHRAGNILSLTVWQASTPVSSPAQSWRDFGSARVFVHSGFQIQRLRPSRRLGYDSLTLQCGCRFLLYARAIMINIVLSPCLATPHEIVTQSYILHTMLRDLVDPPYKLGMDELAAPRLGFISTRSIGGKRVTERSGCSPINPFLDLVTSGVRSLE